MDIDNLLRNEKRYESAMVILMVILSRTALKFGMEPIPKYVLTAFIDSFFSGAILSMVIPLN